MNKKIRDQVIQQGLAVRKWAQDKAGNYEQDLCGWCAICSAELWKRLGKIGLSAEIFVTEVYGISHVFLMMDGYIVDVTASQFSEFQRYEVVIIPEGEGKAYGFYEGNKTFKSAKDLKAYQFRTKWPRTQIVF